MKKLEKLEKKTWFGEMLSIIFLFFRGNIFLPTAQRILFHEKPKNNKTLHKSLACFSNFS